MNIKRILALSLAICLAITFFISVQAAPPNVIIIMADDQGYQDLGCLGPPKIKTPHIDRTAQEGMRFTDFHSGASLFTPSRAALLTCSSASRGGNLCVLFPRDTWVPNPVELTSPAFLNDNC